MDELPYQDEHGDDREAVVREDVPHVGPDHPEGRREGGDVGDPQEADQHHDERGRYPEEEQDGKHDEDSDNPHDWSGHVLLYLSFARRVVRKSMMSVRDRKPNPTETLKMKG